MLLAIYLYDAVLVCAHVVVLYCSSAELSGGPVVYIYIQVHIDKYIPQGGRIACVIVFLKVFLFIFIYYPTAQAATCCLWGIVHYLWKVDAVMQGAYHGWRQSPHNYAADNNILM